MVLGLANFLIDKTQVSQVDTILMHGINESFHIQWHDHWVLIQVSDENWDDVVLQK